VLKESVPSIALETDAGETRMSNAQLGLGLELKFLFEFSVEVRVEVDVEVAILESHFRL